MTVAELISLLEDMPQDADVYHPNDEGDEYLVESVVEGSEGQVILA